MVSFSRAGVAVAGAVGGVGCSGRARARWKGPAWVKPDCATPTETAVREAGDNMPASSRRHVNIGWTAGPFRSPRLRRHLPRRRTARSGGRGSGQKKPALGCL